MDLEELEDCHEAHAREHAHVAPPRPQQLRHRDASHALRLWTASFSAWRGRRGVPSAHGAAAVVCGSGVLRCEWTRHSARAPRFENPFGHARSLRLPGRRRVVRMRAPSCECARASSCARSRECVSLLPLRARARAPLCFCGCANAFLRRARVHLCIEKKPSVEPPRTLSRAVCRPEENGRPAGVEWALYTSG